SGKHVAVELQALRRLDPALGFHLHILAEPGGCRAQRVQRYVRNERDDLSALHVLLEKAIERGLEVGNGQGFPVGNLQQVGQGVFKTGEERIAAHFLYLCREISIELFQYLDVLRVSDGAPVAPQFLVKAPGLGVEQEYSDVPERLSR